MSKKKYTGMMQKRKPETNHKNSQVDDLRQENDALKRQLELQRIKEDVILNGVKNVWQHLERIMIERDNFRRFAPPEPVVSPEGQTPLHGVLYIQRDDIGGYQKIAVSGVYNGDPVSAEAELSLRMALMIMNAPGLDQIKDLPAGFECVRGKIVPILTEMLACITPEERDEKRREIFERIYPQLEQAAQAAGTHDDRRQLQDKFKKYLDRNLRRLDESRLVHLTTGLHAMGRLDEDQAKNLLARNLNPFNE